VCHPEALEGECALYSPHPSHFEGVYAE